MYNDGKKDRGIVIKVCTRMARTGGFAQLASTAHQMRLPFDNDIELTASTVLCNNSTTSGSKYRGG